MKKVTLQRSEYVDTVLVDGKEIITDDGIDTNKLLSRLSKLLGFEYEYIYGEWDDDGIFIPNKK